MAKTKKDTTLRGMMVDVGTSELEGMGKIPPQSRELEQSVLGGILMNNDLLDIVRGILPRAEAFYVTANQDIYKAMIHLREDRQPLDVLTIAEQLKIMGLFDQVGGAGYLAELTGAFASESSVEYAARKVKENYLKRDMILLTYAVNEQCYDPATEYEAMLAGLQNEIIQASNEFYNDADEVSLDGAFIDMVEDAEKRSQAGHELSGLPDHIDAYNELTGGMQRQELEILAGRPSHGKSARAFKRAYELAKLGYHVGISSIEMGQKEFMWRLAAQVAEVDIMKMKKATLTEADFEKLAKARLEINKVSKFMHFDFRNPVSIHEIRAKARVWKMKYGLDEMVVDYIQLVDSGRPVKTYENRNVEVGYVSRGLKSMAKELDCHVTALSQLSRKIEDRPLKSRIPVSADLRESGEIEQDADVIVFIVRWEIWIEKDSPDYVNWQGKAEEFITKQRNGPLGKYKTVFRGRYAQFDNYDEKYKSDMPGNYNQPVNVDKEPF